ncbi:uncharacterized protein [Branchiostoma lanceolatum]|uniref:uncharacterized protein n=1 Tax=Branchiostoma lanceolatum TaxID=7740 RepID=UPI003454AA6B
MAWVCCERRKKQQGVDHPILAFVCWWKDRHQDFDLKVLAWVRCQRFEKVVPSKTMQKAPNQLLCPVRATQRRRGGGLHLSEEVEIAVPSQSALIAKQEPHSPNPDPPPLGLPTRTASHKATPHRSDNEDKKTRKPKLAVVNTQKPKGKGTSKQNGQSNRQQRNNGGTPRNKHTQNTGSTHGNRHTKDTENTLGNKRTQKTGNTQANRQATKKSKAQGNAIINKRPPNNNGQPPNAMNSKKNRGIKTTGTSNQKRQNVKPRSKTPKNKPTKDQRINLNKGIGTKPPKDASKPTNKKVTTSITDNGNRNGKKRHPKTKSNTKLNSLVIPAKTNTKIEKNQGIAKRTTASSIAKGTGQASSDVAMLARKTSSVTGGSSRQDSGCTTAEFKVVVAKITTHSTKIYHSKPKSVELKCTTTFGLYNPEGGVIKKAIVKGNAVISLSHLNSSSVYFACFQATDGPDKKPKCTKFATKARKEEGGTNAPIIAVSATCIIFGTFGLAALIKKACFPKVKCCKTEDKEEGEEEEEEGEEEEEKETEESNRNSGFISKLYVTRARLFFNSCSSNKDEEPESSTDEESNESTDEDPTYGTLPFRHSVIQLDQVETVSNEQTCVEFEEKSSESTSTDDSVAPNFGDVDGPEE